VARKSKVTTTKSGELAQLEAVFAVMNQHGVAELDWEQGTTRIHVKMPSACSGTPMMVSSPQMVAPTATHSAAPASSVGNTGAADKAASTIASNQKQILSPFVGTFYRSASPTTDVYVKEGKAVKRGDVLCIIEAMKLMNEIESEHNGKIIQILVENGQPVEFGEPLFLIEL